MAVLVPCAEHGCPELVERGRCAAHSQERSRARGTTKERGYCGTWPKLRKMILRRDMHLCQECLKIGRTERATEVDHILSMSRGGERLNPENLQSLCIVCHSRKTMAEQNGAPAAIRTPI